MIEFISNFRLSRYGVLILVFLIFSTGLYFWGFFRFLKRLILDCLIDHATGKITINNVARFGVLVAFIYTYVGGHFEIHIKPVFKIVSIPMSEWEMLVILSFIVGAQAVRKLDIKNPFN